jgi:hypothetical protein
MLKILLTDLYIVDKMDVPSKYTIVKAVGVSGQVEEGGGRDKC